MATLWRLQPKAVRAAGVEAATFRLGRLTTDATHTSDSHVPLIDPG